MPFVPYIILGIFDKEGRIHAKIVGEKDSVYHDDYWPEHSVQVAWRWLINDWNLNSFDAAYREYSDSQRFEIEQICLNLVNPPEWALFNYVDSGKTDEERWAQMDEFDKLTYRQKLAAAKRGKI